MPEREERIAAFLAANGWRREEARPLAGDASFRRYFRLEDGRRRAVLMDAPPSHEDVRPFARIARHLRWLGLSAPRIFAEDAGAGLLLLEDFGDATFSRLLAAGAAEEPLYRLAVDVLIHLHRQPPVHALPPWLPPYDERRLLEEACLLTEWYLPAVLGRPAEDAVRRDYVDAWRPALGRVHALPRTLVLRDFHVDNLIRLDGRRGVSACGLLDFQDAVAGPAAYDLMSLLEDARRNVPAPLRSAMLARYRAAFPALDWPEFEAAFTILAAQRHAKVIGIFTRLSRRDGKSAYLVHIPRVWRLLEDALRHPALAALEGWFARHLPGRARTVPSHRSAAQ